MAEFEFSSEESKQGFTAEELFQQSQMEEHWFDHLDAPRQAIANEIMSTGLTGRLVIFNGYEFAWKQGTGIMADSERQKTFAEAFDRAVARLPR